LVSKASVNHYHVQPSKTTNGLVDKIHVPPAQTQGRMFTHQISDGDNVLLHKQGSNMHDDGLFLHTGYFNPSSADTLLNAYRRFLDTAATLTQQVRHASYTDAVVGFFKLIHER
jgi:hypothetical protein